MNYVSKSIEDSSNFGVVQTYSVVVWNCVSCL